MKWYELQISWTFVWVKQRSSVDFFIRLKLSRGRQVVLLMHVTVGLWEILPRSVRITLECSQSRNTEKNTHDRWTVSELDVINILKEDSSKKQVKEKDERQFKMPEFWIFIPRHLRLTSCNHSPAYLMCVYNNTYTYINYRDGTIHLPQDSILSRFLGADMICIAIFLRISILSSIAIRYFCVAIFIFNSSPWGKVKRYT